MKLQNDWYNRHAAEHMSHWVEILKDNRDKLTETGREGLAVLQEWKKNPVNRPGSAGAAIFQVWYLRLMEEVFRERLGEDLWQQFLQNPYVAYNSLEYLLLSEDTPWLPQGLKAPLLASYKRAMQELKKMQAGEAPRKWRWDEMQTMHFEHDLGKVPVIGDYLFNRGPYPYGGGPMTVGRAAYSLSEPFKVSRGAGLRFISVLDKEGIKAKAVLAGGQSGHPLSEHYDDQIEAWLEGEYYEVGMPGDGF
jgi:penicillin amidase